VEIEEAGKKILNEHQKLYDILLKIPKGREILYNDEMRDGKKIGKPRFKNHLYRWNSELQTRLHDHLQDIWNFFENYSYWFDNTLFPLLSWKFRKKSKKSVIFLLEQDIYSTDEVYGDYLIENVNGQTSISYYRRGNKIRQFSFTSLDDGNIKDWICNDAIKQVEEQFTYLWQKLDTEIMTCIQEKYKKLPSEIETNKYLLEQFKICKNLQNTFPESAMLCLGRISEHWLLIALNLTQSNFREDIIRRARLEGILNEDQTKLYKNIRKTYNNLKHKTFFGVKDFNLSNLIEGFSSFLNEKNRK
jgi:hypothetical protein